MTQTRDECRKAAEQGHAGAQSCLGGMYQFGQGVPPNNILAYAWASLGAMSCGGQSVQIRNLIAKKLSPEDLSKGQAEATRLHALIEKNKGE